MPDVTSSGYVTRVVNIQGHSEVSHDQIAAAMAEPGFYTPVPTAVERRETHTSTVFLAGDSAYKIKKPVRFGFLDYRRLPTRRQMCEREVMLNRRLAPSIYRGVCSITSTDDGFALAPPDQPRALEYAVHMRRFDEARTLAAQVARHSAGLERIREVAEVIAYFHAAAPVIDRLADPRPAIKRAAGETFTSTLELVDPSRETELLAAERFTNAFLVTRRDAFLERSAAGLVRDGHGDLRAEHVVMEQSIEIVDCVEFDPALRQVDVSSDLAFLVMDLHRLGARALADELVQAYRAAGGDPGDDGLLSFYAAQRAWVRAKVELLRARQLEARGEDSQGLREAADGLLELGRRFAWKARRPLMLVVCGLSGSGKSHLAAALSRRSDLAAIASDVVRKRLASASGQRSIYTPEFSARTYAELGRLAAAEMERSGGVIVDATFRRTEDRRAFSDAAGDAFAAARFVECVAPSELRLRRVTERARQATASDATPAIAEAQVFEELAEVPPSSHLPLRTDRTVSSSLAEIECWLDSASS